MKGKLFQIATELQREQNRGKTPRAKRRQPRRKARNPSLAKPVYRQPETVPEEKKASESVSANPKPDGFELQADRIVADKDKIEQTSPGEATHPDEGHAITISPNSGKTAMTRPGEAPEPRKPAVADNSAGTARSREVLEQAAPGPLKQPERTQAENNQSASPFLREPEGAGQAETTTDNSDAAASFSWEALEEAATAMSGQEDNTDTFQDDLRAIMSGQKQYDPETGSVATSTDKTPEPEPEAESEQSDRYAIFDRIAKAQDYVNTFDLGTIEVQQRMDELDRELDATKAKQASIPLKKDTNTKR